MKTIIVYMLLCFPFINSIAQSNFSNGYKKGFIEGYCYQNTQNRVVCIDPLVPLSPLADISREENEDNFNNGYDRGFEDGKVNFLAQNIDPKNLLYISKEVPKVYEPDLRYLISAVIQQRDISDKYIAFINQTCSNDDAKNMYVQFLTNNQNSLEKTISDYNSISKNLLDTVRLKDGWHEIAMIYNNKYEFAGNKVIKEINIAKGYIKGGRLMELYKNNYSGYKSMIPETYSSEMNFEKGFIKLNYIDLNNSEQELVLMALKQYYDSNYSDSPPVNSSKIVLWSKNKELEGKTIEIKEMESSGWVNNTVKTTIKYSAESPKSCDCSLKPGKINLGSITIASGKAYPITGNNYITIDVSENNCLSIEYMMESKRNSKRR